MNRMALFRGKRQAAFASAPITAAAGIAGQRGVSQYLSYSVGYDIERAQTIPTLSRAQNLLVSLIAGLDLKQYVLEWNPLEEEYTEVHLPGEGWMSKPCGPTGPTRQFFIGSIVGDLFWHGRAFAAVTSRYSSGYPATFAWLPAGSVSTLDQVGPIWFGPSSQIEFAGQMLDPANVIQFISPTPGVLWTGARSIEIALRLDVAAQRFASNEIAAGYLQVKPGGEPMSGDDLADLASSWATARATNAIGALNEYVEFVEFKSDPSKLQLMEGRQHAALELSRVANIPPWLLGLDVGGLTYQNAQDAMRQLWLLGARPIMTTIEETLSGDNVLPRGRHVCFDVDDIVGEEELEAPMRAPGRATPTDMEESAS